MPLGQPVKSPERERLTLPNLRRSTVVEAAPPSAESRALLTEIRQRVDSRQKEIEQALQTASHGSFQDRVNHYFQHEHELRALQDVRVLLEDMFPPLPSHLSPESRGRLEERAAHRDRLLRSGLASRQIEPLLYPRFESLFGHIASSGRHLIHEGLFRALQIRGNSEYRNLLPPPSSSTLKLQVANCALFQRLSELFRIIGI